MKNNCLQAVDKCARETQDKKVIAVLTLLRPLGRIRPKRIHLGIPPISPRRRRV